MKFLKTKSPDRVILFEIGIILALLAVNYVFGLSYNATFVIGDPIEEPPFDTLFIYNPPADPIIPEVEPEQKQEPAQIFDITSIIKQVPDVFKVEEKKLPKILPPNTGLIAPIKLAPRHDSSRIIDIYEAEIMPEFPGGPDELQKYISDNYEIPYHVMNMVDEIKMNIEFIIDEKGQVVDVKILTCSKPGLGAEREAIRVYRNMPKWTPAEFNGHPVKIRLRQPFNIRVDSY